MRKILIVITTGLFQYGGLSAVALNYFRAMDTLEMSIDFCSFTEPEPEVLDIIVQKKSRYFRLSKRRNVLKYFCELFKLCKRYNYDVIHVHGNSATMLLELLPARIAGVNKRISHVHTTQSKYPLLNNILKPLFNKTYTDAIAVSKEAGKWLYDKDFVVFNNAIDLNKYFFSEQKRIEIRKGLNLTDSFVIGTVGKLNAGKNHKYMLEILNKLKHIRPNSTLLLIGGGEEEDKLRKYVKELDMEKNVIFLGMQNHVEDFYPAMDCFLFTSTFEGFGMVLVEAQVSGLFCVSADTVPVQTKITNRIKYLSLDSSTDDWCFELNNLYETYERKLDECEIETIIEKGFDISYEASKLRSLYLGEK